MSNKRFFASRVLDRLRRIEAKCDILADEVRSLRGSLTPSDRDIEEVIEQLHRTARAMKEESERERLWHSRSEGV